MILGREQARWGLWRGLKHYEEKIYTVATRIKPWLESLEFLLFCIKTGYFFHNSFFRRFPFLFLCAFMKSRPWCIPVVETPDVVDRGQPREWRWRRYVELTFSWFRVSGQASTSQQSISHLKLLILIALNPPRGSELHMWSSLWE